MKWTWFRKDVWGFLFILLGIYAIVLYVNEGVGQRGGWLVKKLI